MPQATITTAIYDTKRKVLIPKETPSYSDFKEVMVVFVPKTKASDGWRQIISLLEKSADNRDVPQEELDDVVAEAVAAVRKRPKEQFILD